MNDSLTPYFFRDFPLDVHGNHGKVSNPRRVYWVCTSETEVYAGCGEGSKATVRSMLKAMGFSRIYVSYDPADVSEDVAMLRELWKQGKRGPAFPGPEYP